MISVSAALFSRTVTALRSLRRSVVRQVQRLGSVELSEVTPSQWPQAPADIMILPTLKGVRPMAKDTSSQNAKADRVRSAPC
ncbi:hypothetical protein BaRGS_00000530 [Batillaria attramentaria]|uniref:Uncharacterized protein n=1 Tax=Batillaria attramentaria TaxID=370345 RepID=A0ABD0MAS5_9CAEN